MIGIVIWFVFFSVSTFHSDGLFSQEKSSISYSEIMAVVGVTAGMILIVYFGVLLFALTYPSEEEEIQKRIKNRSKNIYKYQKI